MSEIKVTINGKDIPLENVSNVEQLVSARSITGMFVIEKNKEIIQKEDYSKTLVINDDVFEIVGFFGGG